LKGTKKQDQGNILGEIVRPGEGSVAVGTEVRSLLGVSPYMSMRQGDQVSQPSEGTTGTKTTGNTAAVKLGK
jgi:hypothetical protein